MTTLLLCSASGAPGATVTALGLTLTWPRHVMPVDADRRLTSACQAVMAAPSLAIPFEQHAEAAGASVRTLARLFQNNLGMGFAEWRRQVQLATAVAALIQGQSVSGIARALGYSPSSFSDMFRRELGVAPSQYSG